MGTPPDQEMTALAKRASLKKLAVWLGRCLLLAALIFLAFELRKHWSGISEWRPTGQDVAFLFGLALIYALTLLLLAECWHWILKLFGNLQRKLAYASFLITQVAKYLPGNVAHLIGRGLYVRGNGLKDGQIVQATLLELAIIPLGAIVAILILGCAGQLSSVLPFFPVWLWWLGSATVLASSAVGIVFSSRLGLNLRPFLLDLSFSLCLSILFMGLLGAIFAAIFLMLSSAPVATLAGSAILSWLVGYLTPGSPGGLGTREATLFALLSSLQMQDAALLAAALFRLVTVLGDLIAFLAGWFLFRNTDKSKI